MSYTDNGNGTVTDNNTGLMWQKEDDGNIYYWYQAAGVYDATYNSSSQNVCGSLSLGGFSDWRLPTKKELMSIVDYSIPYPGPTINTTYFPNTNATYYWSSTTIAYGPGGWGAWDVAFAAGSVHGAFKGYDGMYVRCVRGGQGNFNDVPPGYWAYHYIDSIYSAGITAGCGNGNYCPENPVTRAQMAVFIMKEQYGSEPVCDGNVLCKNTTPYFTDVPANHWAFKFIQKMKETGITAGCGSGLYCPDDSVTRAQMAVFLTKAFLE